jgi:CubicO group peptidase (beta-lactamase class C family)
MRLLVILALIVAGLPMQASADDEYPIGGLTSLWGEAYVVGSYRHLGEIYYSRPVSRRAPAGELPRGQPIDVSTYDLRGMPRSLEDYLERARTTGFIVLKNGKIVFERYRLGADERSLFTSMSVAKSLVSTLVGFAIADGLIGSVNEPISDYLPELAGSGYDGVPIKAVLQMSSGVDFVEDYDSASSDSSRMWNESVVYNNKAITEFVRSAKRSRAPFARFHYAGVETVALGWLVARVSGRTLSDYLSEKLWGPLGMEADANWVVDGHGPAAVEAAFCCFNATLRDYARFGLLIAQGGRWEGGQLLPEAWVREATAPDRPQVQPGKLYPGYDLGYQYQWWTFPGPDRAFTGQGVNGQFVYVNPAENLVIVVTSVWPDWWSEDLEQHTYAIFAAFAQALR